MKKKLKIILSIIAVLLLVGVVVGIVSAVHKQPATNNNHEVTALSFDPLKLNTSLQNEHSSKTDVVALRIEPATAEIDASKLVLTSDNEEVATATFVGEKATDGVIGVEVLQLFEGSATITAQYKDITATLDVEVIVLSLDVAQMSFAETEATIYLTDDSPVFVSTYGLLFEPHSADFTKIQFSTSDSNIAYVSSVDDSAINGSLSISITAKNAGTATITATFKDVSCSMTVTVRDARVSVISAVHISYDGSNGSIDGQTIQMNVNDVPTTIESDEFFHTLQLKTRILPSYVVNKSVVWTSSDTAVVTVSEDGLVTAVGPGTATVTATAGNGVSASINVNSIVFYESKTITGYELFNYSPTETVCRMFQGDTLQLGIEFQPSNTNDPRIASEFWHSSHTDIVTVDSNGLLTAVGTGIATVRFDSNMFLTNGLKIYVVAPFEEVYLDVTNNDTTLWNLNEQLPYNDVILPEGEVRAENHYGIGFPEGSAVLQLSAKPFDVPRTYENGQSRFSFASSDKSIVTVDKNGLVKAKRTGTAVITATADNGVFAEVSITVLTYMPTLSSSVTLPKGENYQLPLYYTLFDCSSSNDSVVSVDGNAVITANAAGTANISVRLINPLDGSEERTETITVTVSDDPETFADYSWERIAELSESGEASQRFKVGDEKQVHLTNGSALTFVIVGFNHDVRSSDVNGKPVGLTLGLKTLYSSTTIISAMNETNSNTASPVMSATLSSIYELIPGNLQNFIKTVQKQTSAGGKSRTIKTTEDKLFLFSEKEVFGTCAGSFDGEGTQYPYFAQNANRIFTINDTASNWLLRSPTKDSYTTFRSVYQSGVVGNINANAQAGVRFGFCV